MRELVMRYKAEKVCHEEMVKMPLVDLKVLEDGSFRTCTDYRELSKIDLYSGCHQMRVHEDEIPKTAFRMRYVYMKSKKVMTYILMMNLDAAEKEKLSIRIEPEGRYDGWWSYLGVVIARPSTIWERANVVDNAWSDVRTLIVEEAHATKYFVRPGAEIEESKMIGLELEQETTKVVMIKERLKKAKDRQEGELIVEMKLLGFSVGDHVMMKVSPWKGVVCFGKKGELAPRYIGPFEILERIGPVAYRLRLPDELSIGSYLSGVKILSKPEIALNIVFKDVELV
ncbi:hypothetical protein Tco_1467970 [Tanacetum coccineum]